MIGRREFIALLGGAAAWAHPTLAQTTRARPLVGILGYTDAPDFRRIPLYAALLEGLRKLGHSEGRTFDLAFRSAEGRAERSPQAAATLVQLSPDVIVATATLEAVALKSVTDTIPIVAAVLADPLGLGFAASDARPGGNVTGIAPYVKGLPSKQLELAREIVPGATRIGLLHDDNDPKAHPQRREIEAMGKELGLQIATAAVRAPGEIGPSFQAWASQGVTVAIIEQSNMLFVLGRKQIVEAAAATRIPTVYGYREHTEAGGLISYGINLIWCFQRAAHYVDRILKGDKVGNLPIEFPTRIELVINLKTAKALGLDVPATLLARADEVIE
jgi:putative tryptophan/tyrosine transport system substrate-binding protein